MVQVDGMTLRDLDNLFAREERRAREAADDMARQAWYNGLFVRLAMSEEAYPDSPEDWTPTALARQAEERRRFHASYTVDEVWDELGDPNGDGE